MAKKRTQEELLKLVDEACELYKQSIKLSEEAGKKLKLCGVQACGAGKNFENEYEIHLFGGIMKIEKITGIKAVHPVEFGKRKREKKEVIHSGVRFFQLGEPVEKSYKY